MVFSPHPDDETLACGGSISKAIKENKKVKVIFMTNGDAYPESASIWLKKKPQELTAEDYIVFGKERKKEALRAIKILGLKQKDAIFLNYPDNGLFSLWTQEEFPGKKKYSKRNLLNDIKNILSDYQPKIIYLPHPADNHKDHQATTLFVYLALKELKDADKNNSWIDSLEPYYYLVHRALNDNLFQVPARRQDIVDFKQQKLKALNQYHTQLTSDKEFLEGFIKDSELFWDVPKDKPVYLNNLETEWQGIAEYMRSKGYNVNFAPVVDVADNIENMNNPLVKKQRMYSQDPRVVSEVACAIISGMIKGKIIPVLKHFPGLGRVDDDTHLMLPKATVSDTELYKRDLFPFSELIKKYPGIWIMIDHAIYPGLSDKPASLSYEIQTKLLREKLGFKGIIVADELLGMRAIKEYALREAIREPVIGEIVARAFEAGTDIAVIYPPCGNTERVVSDIIKNVRQAVKEGRLDEKSINESVIRILKEKEKIFGRRLVYLVKKMPLAEKIGQKLVFDYHNDIGVFNKYNIGGVYLHDHNAIDKTQKDTKIPLFIIGQHEGGIISQYTVNSRSAYVIGKEFEVLVKKDKADVGGNMRLLCLAAHPDDEDGEALVYFREKLNYQTYLLLATRGEGGRDKISSALGDELGILRTKEEEKAASILGVRKVYYLGKTDFGYTLSVDKSLEKWGKKDTLEKLVYFIRLIRPQIIITKHNDSDPKEHGQHQALVMLAKEAFDLAGDPKAYPGMIRDGLLPWQPLKFYQRSTNNEADAADNQLKINSAEYIPAERKTIHQIAFKSLTQHRSQSNWEHLRTNIPKLIRYQLVKSGSCSEKENYF
ncbi:MAG: PIG-L family deacetylase [Candidatus Omnitrophica bacterium]|nr:PIG-L family deacetylase [Candidatus Omnitrophota bacterium]